MRAQNSRRVAESKASGIPQIPLIFALAVSLMWGGQAVMNGTLTIGILVAFYAYVIRLLEPLATVVDIDTRLLWIKACAARVMAVLEARSTLLEVHSSDKRQSVVRSGLSLSRVSFSYPGGPLVLDEIDLTVQPGEVLAIVGPSGSGKSTLGKMLLRLYDPASGTLYLDGIDIRAVPLSALRSVCALVPATPYVSEGTILENLLIGNSPATSLSECEEVLRTVHLLEFVYQQPAGLHTRLGVRGAGLSFGQRQRIGIARALLRKPRVLVMDECTSGVDLRTESALLRQIKNKLQFTATMIISHRPETYQWADRVARLADGKIHSEFAVENADGRSYA